MGLLTRSTGIARSASIFRTRPVSREVRNYVRRVRKLLADLAIPVDLVNKPSHDYLDRGTLRVERKIRAIQRTEVRRSSRELGLEASLGRFEERPLRGASLAFGVAPSCCGAGTDGHHILLTAAMRARRPNKDSNACFARASL